MLQMYIDEYVQTNNRINDDKTRRQYKSDIEKCVNYFHERGIERPNAQDWDELSLYLKEQGLSEITIKTKYTSRAKKFYLWLEQKEASGTPEQPENISTPEQPERLSSETQSPKAERLSISISASSQEALRTLSLLEGRSVGAIVMSLIDDYIAGHSEQLKILKAAILQARGQD